VEVLSTSSLLEVSWFFFYCHCVVQFHLLFELICHCIPLFALSLLFELCQLTVTNLFVLLSLLLELLSLPFFMMDNLTIHVCTIVFVALLLALGLSNCLCFPLLVGFLPILTYYHPTVFWPVIV